MTDTIALFVPTLGGGGAERVMVTIANVLVEKGHAVDLILVQTKGPYLSDVHPSVRIVDLRAGRAVRSLVPLARYLRTRRPRVLLSTRDHANTVALLARQISRVDTRVVIRIANVLSTSFACSQVGRARFILAPLVKRFYRRADEVIAVSRGVAEDAIKFASLSRDHVVVINNPVQVDRVVERARAQLEETWFVPGAPPVVLGVGRLTEQKDFGTLIRAFALVIKERDARLIILGEGEERDKLESLVAELNLQSYVLMPGFATNPYAYMARAAVFVLSSKWEGFPNAMLEAIAVGTPIVATDCVAGPADILEDGRYGQLIPVGDHEAMARAIVTQFDGGPGPRTDLQARAADFSHEAIVAQYESLLLDIAK